MPTISALIQGQRDALGVTYRDMAQKAAVAGYHVKHQTLQQLATAPPKEWPKRADTIRAMAAALDVSERMVVLAFGRSFGLDVTSGESLLEVLLPSGTAEVDPGLQQAIASVVRAAVAAHYERGDTSPAPQGYSIRSERDPAGGVVVYGVIDDDPNGSPCDTDGENPVTRRTDA